MLPPNWNTLPLPDVARLAPVQRLEWPLLKAFDIELAVKREDLLHPKLGGNKFYKLHGHLERFHSGQSGPIVTFGGAYSNHIYALAAAGQDLAVPTVGVIRGERPPTLSSTLADAQAMGMELVFISRERYREKMSSSLQDELDRRFGTFYVIPEGGAGDVGALGCATWAQAALDLAPWTPTALCVAAGTGATAAGLLAASQTASVHVYLALKGRAEQLREFELGVQRTANNVRAMLSPRSKEKGHLPALTLERDYHCGGYARFPDYLRAFVAEFEGTTGMALDPVYTAKLFWGIAQNVQAGLYPPGSRLLAFHTGGLQGWRGYRT